MHYGVLIGRFQPFHRGHHEIVKAALSQVDRLILLVGSASNPCTPKNPLTFDERLAIISSALTADEADRISVMPIEDFPYNDHRWIAGVHSAIQEAIEYDFSDYQYDGSKISLIGHAKDHSSYYLKMFPEFGSIDVPNFQMLNATDVRNLLNKEPNIDPSNPRWMLFMVDEPHSVMTHAILNEALTRIADEITYIETYKKSWENSPYPPGFLCSDAVVICAGHILLVQRGKAPGKDLWALPGGHKNPWENFEECAIRELKEETRLKVPAPVLRGSIKKIRTADYPYRSERGQYVSQVFHMEIGFNINDPIELPKVIGRDDAKDAKWVKLSDFVNMRSVMFEDHFSIVTDLLGII